MNYGNRNCPQQALFAADRLLSALVEPVISKEREVDLLDRDQNNNDMKRPLRLGIVGAGMIVTEFLPKLTAMEGLEVAAIFSRTIQKAQKLAREHGIDRVCLTYDELLTCGIDAVYIALPNDLHAFFAERALMNSVNVIVEKPIASNFREAEALAKLAEAKKCFLIEAISTPYIDSFKILSKWLSEIGELRLAECRYTQYSRRFDRFRAGELPDVFDPAHSGGALMDLGVYNISLLIGLLGEPTGLQYHATIERGIDISGVITLQYPRFQAVGIAAKDCACTPVTLFLGTKGRITAQGHPGRIARVTLTRSDGTEESFEDTSFTADSLPHFSAFLRAWQKCDRSFFDRGLEASLTVCSLMTQAREYAGVRFPSDEN